MGARQCRHHDKQMALAWCRSGRMKLAEEYGIGANKQLLSPSYVEARVEQSIKTSIHQARNTHGTPYESDEPQNTGGGSMGQAVSVTTTLNFSYVWHWSSRYWHPTLTKWMIFQPNLGSCAYGLIGNEKNALPLTKHAQFHDPYHCFGTKATL